MEASSISFIDPNEETDDYNNVDEVEYNWEDDNKIYEGSEISVKEFSIAFTSLKIRHHLNRQTANDILKLIRIILPKPSRLTIIKTIDVLKPKLNKICVKCRAIMTNNGSNLNCMELCKNCNQEMTNFVAFDLANQLNLMCQKKSILKQIEESNLSSREKSIYPIACLNNATDGKIYQSFIRSINDNRLIISLNLNSDGAPIDKIGKYNLWPVLGTIVELNQESRESFRNMVILGLWVSKEKPTYNELLQECLQELIDNDSKERQKYVIMNNRIVRVQLALFDLIAKAAMTNIKQFNGNFGCAYCHHPGNYDYNFRKMTYKPNTEGDKKPKTHDNYQTYALLAEENKTAVYGIKGQTCLSKIISLPDQLPLDYMHLFCAGHGKWLLKHYLERDGDCSVYDHIKDIDTRLKSATIPHLFNRKIKSIMNNDKWKCSQVKLFFFYMAVPTLIDILPNDYFILLCGYICAMRLLYEPIANLDDIEIAENLLKSYYESLGLYYGDFAYDYTVHAHLHLAEQVRNHGPLHCHSQFAFEV